MQLVWQLGSQPSETGSILRVVHHLVDKYSKEGTTMILRELMKFNETVQPLPSDMPIEDMIEALEKRLAAAKRGLGFANRMHNPLQKKKHTAAVLGNLNSIRSQLTRLISQMEQFYKASREFETGTSYPESGAQNDIQQDVPSANRAESRAAFANAR